MLDFDTSGLTTSGGMGLSGEKQPYDYNNPKHIDLSEIKKITPASYGLTIDNMRQYIFGIDVVDPETLERLPDSAWEQFIEQAIQTASHELGIQIFPMPIAQEKHDYIQNEFYTNNYIQVLKRPIIQVQSIEMLFNNQPMIKYPTSMWKVYHLTGELKTYPADLLNGAGAMSSGLNPAAMGLAGMPLWSQIGLNNNQDAPQATSVTYIAGLLPPANKYAPRDWEMPADLKALITQYVLKHVIEIWGELIMKPGIAGTSISADGLGQSINATLSAENTGGTARIMLINKTIAELKDSLKNYFGSFNEIGI